MGYDIHVVPKRDEFGRYDTDNKGLYFARSDFEGWEDLFDNRFGFITFDEFIASGAAPSDWGKAYSQQVERLAVKFPLLSRLHDWYMDAEFLENEIQLLSDEVSRVSTKDSNIFLNQLLEAIEVATRHGACIVFAAD